LSPTASGTNRALDGYAGLFAPRVGNEGDIQTIAVAETARCGEVSGDALMNALIGEARTRAQRSVPRGAGG
jgi:ribosomal protein S18 acetylase RimI-like enzyme